MLLFQLKALWVPLAWEEEEEEEEEEQEEGEGAEAEGEEEEDSAPPLHRQPQPLLPQQWAPFPRKQRRNFLPTLAAAARRRRASCPQRTTANTPKTWRRR